MKTLTIRGIPDDLGKAIQKQASIQNLSMNEWLLQSLAKWTGLDKKHVFREHHDLDELAGTWTQREGEQFLRSIRPFEHIDADIWK